MAIVAPSLWSILCSYQTVSQITGVDCPEGAAIAGNTMYVSTQCGGGRDPVYVVDNAQ
jgi:hypothetical protein